MIKLMIASHTLRVSSLAAAFFACGLLVFAEAPPLGSAAVAPHQAPPAAPEAVAVVDWTHETGTINRGLFGTQGFMQIYVEPDPMVMRTFCLTNPEGTCTRLETYIHQMEPENDNDDPSVFRWEGFHPDKMIRFIENRAAFEATLDRMGIERLSLLCYNVDWLRSDNPDDPIRDKDEWAEFAAAVVETYNGRGANYRPALRYVEVWNEPNMAQFYTGTMESYFDLFTRTANRLHRDYPGVLVGGPALTHAPDCKPREWMEAFLRACGSRADYISYHPYGESVEKIIADIRHWVGEFRKIPGKEQGKVMLTETDAWFDGWPKIQYMLDRQFRFLDISDLILSIHHFCCLAYRETGHHTFGIVDKQGAVIEGTFWPYWLFRNLIGRQAWAVRQGTRQGDFDLAASFLERDGQGLATAVFHNKSTTPIFIQTLLYYAPADKERVLAFNRVARDFKGVERIDRIAPQSARQALDLALAPGEAVALTLQEPGKRFFSFSDMNNQEGPWLDLDADKNSLRLGDRFTLTGRILNTLPAPVSGRLVLHGLPEKWSVESDPAATQVVALAAGESRTVHYRVQASTLLEMDRIAPYVAFEDFAGASEVPLSIPVSLQVQIPLAVQELPLPVYAVRGETNRVTLQLTNQTDEAVEGRFGFEPPRGFGAGKWPNEFTVPARERRRFEFEFVIPSDAPPGPARGMLLLDYLGGKFTRAFTVEVVPGTPRAGAVALDLGPWVNVDPVAFDANRGDYAKDFLGMYAYPADYTPSDQVVRVRGIPYRLALLDDGKKNAILPEGQTLQIPEGRHAGVAFLGFGHDGKHPGTWVFHYTDGTREAVESQIPEWCCPTPEGFEVAFNAPYRYMSGGPAPPACQFFAWTLRTDPEKTLRAIELPRLRQAYLFAITLLGSEPLDADSPSAEPSK